MVDVPKLRIQTIRLLPFATNLVFSIDIKTGDSLKINRYSITLLKDMDKDAALQFLVHATLTLLFRHTARAKAHVVTVSDGILWAFASCVAASECVTALQIAVPPILPASTLELPPQKMVETYYYMLKDRVGSKEGEGQETPPYMVEADTEDTNEGSSRGAASDDSDEDLEGDSSGDSEGDSEEKSIYTDSATESSITEFIKHLQKLGIGNQSAKDSELYRLYEQYKPTRPRIDRIRTLLRQVQGYGTGKFFVSSKPARKNPFPDVLNLTYTRRIIERTAVVADISGSMYGYREQIYQAIGDVLNACETVDLYLADTKVLGTLKKIRRPEQIQILDGGGTDMGRSLWEVRNTRKYRNIVMITDNQTYWNDVDPITDVNVYAILVGEVNEELPSWIRRLT